MTAAPTLKSVNASIESRMPVQGPLAQSVARLRHRGAKRWYRSSVWGLVYLAIPLVLIWSGKSDIAGSVLLTALIVLIAALYLVMPPLMWGRPWYASGIGYLVFIGVTCLGIPFIGEDVIWFWIYVPVMAAMSWQPRWFMIATIVAIGLAQLVVMGVTGTFGVYWYAAALTASIGIMMFAFGQQLQAMQKLRDAQGEIARLAVVDERERFARDMHDVLGHSLTVVTVKSELARKLVARDPERAEEELADIERLSRAALADLRASVAGYRAMTLETELSAAHAALVAADVVPHLPASADVVSPELRETFAWVLRESVTNVVRHARAKNCWVALEKRAIIIGDDGRGMAAPVPAGVAPGQGHGLEGMRERAAKVGATVTISPGEDGGTTVAVRAPGSGGAA